MMAWVIHMLTRTDTMNTEIQHQLALTRLLQMISPSLPIGGYTYSQGIEWAVESGWISDARNLSEWLGGLMRTNLHYLELPLLKRMLEAWAQSDSARLEQLNDTLLASRETRELRLEETNRARAFCDLLQSLEPEALQFQPILRRSQLACFSFACHRWGIDYELGAQGLLMSWLENLVLSAVKIIPLGQTAGQQVIFDLGGKIPAIVASAGTVDDEEIGASSMAAAIASANHETQYTRLFRS
jgi:urease accessory protein